MSTAGKVRGLVAALAWRRSIAGPVVFTNGVFDLLHPGHVELLEAARQEGDALVVGVNRDASARRLGKGPGRPVATEEARARVLAGLAAVDCVVLFEEDTPLALIQALEPDVLVKGADYTRDTIVGADWVEARGGRVVRVPLLAGHSTSALVERTRESS
jgi:rfaE bifunctional protein nucleotidyltransferase chain/domain